MPSASAKLEKQASTEAVDPLRQAITIIEHKIRNLEKRKVKLEAYKEEQKNGKDLNSDQFSAVSKYDEVIQTLEFARELCKQFNGIAADSVKTLKKQQRKEQLERTQQEINRIKEILIIQEVLLNVGQETVREDFLAARNGALQLTEEDLKNLDDLYVLLSPKHIPEENMPPYQEQLTHSAEHMINLIEGRQKEVASTTYAGLKDLITRIHTCGYFDQNPEEEEEAPANEEVAEEVGIQQEEASIENYGEPCPVPPEVMESNLVVAASEILPPPPNLTPAAVIPPETSFFTPPVPTSNVASANVSYSSHPPTAASIQQQQQPPMQSAQGLPDTFDSGFDFIQESQLEVEAPVPPHVDLAGMLVQQTGGGHPPVPSAHFRPSRPGVPQQTPVAPAAQPPSVQSSQLAPVVAEFVAAVTAPAAPIPSQTFTNQNFSILPVPGSAQPVVASPTPGIAPPTYPDASAPVSAQLQPTPQTAPAPTAQHIPGFARASSNTFQAPVQGMTSAESAPNQPIPIQMAQQRVTEEPDYAASAAAPFVPASVAQSTYSSQSQQPNSQSFVQQQPQPPQPVGQARFPNAYGDSPVTGDPTSDKARFGTNELAGETVEEPELHTSTSWADTSQEEVFIQQNQRGNYGNGRGGRGGMMRGRGNSNNYSGRGRGNYQNGRGGYAYRGNQEGGNNYYQNGYQQRDNYNNSSGGGYGNGGYKSGGRGGGGGASGNGGGMQRGGGVNRGRGGGGGGGGSGSGGRGALMRGGRGNYIRGGAGGGGNKQ